MSSVLERTLRSRVAIRVAMLFIVCAIAPLVGLGLVTVVQTSRQIEGQARDRLEYDAKAAARQIFEQLNLFQSAGRIVGSMITTGHSTTEVLAQLDALLESAPAAVAVVRPDGTAAELRGQLEREGLSAEQWRHLSDYGALIQPVQHVGSGEDGVAMLVRLGDAASEGALAVSLRLTDLIGGTAAELLPPQTRACLIAGLRIVCSAGAPAGLAAGMQRLGDDATGAVPTDAGDHLMRTRTLPLQSLYGAGSWQLAMARPVSFVRAPLGRFQRDFWLVLLLSALGVTWLSLSQVRRQLRPLVQLAEAAKRIARRDFETPVGVRSGDEFEEVGAVFAEMSAELRQHLEELEAFSVGTLTALSRTIDAKSSWTSGHSERVTRLAVAIAEQLGLPQDEVRDLRRGGLVHDIGKLATPITILDKTGALTDQEMEILRRHPTDGVHILEPIPAFKALLPIVGQHHERWDGRGYPEGLAGTAIAQTARIVAVADACDAMHSDRPYRRGLPLTAIVDRLRAGAGTQFDPDVVEAAVAVFDRAASDDALAHPA